MTECKDLVGRAASLAERWPTLPPAARCRTLQHVVDRIDLKRETLEIRIMPGRLPAVLYEKDDPTGFEEAASVDEPTVTVTVPARLKRAGMEMKLLVDGNDGSPRRAPDQSLLRLLGQAQLFYEMVIRNRGKTIAEIAEEAGVGGSYFTRILRLNFLAPDVVKAILRDQHPLELTAKKLSGDTRLPIAWEEQRAKFGIA